MNKIWMKRSALLFALCLLLVNTSGCEHLWNAEQRGESSVSIPVPDSIKVNIPGPAVEISGGIYEMKVGEVLYPYIEALPTGTSYKLNASTFSANNDDIIQVQESSIIGKAPGTVMVTSNAWYSDGNDNSPLQFLKTQFEVRVTDAQSPTTISATTKKAKAKSTGVAKFQAKPAMTAVLSMVQTTARTSATTMRTIAKTTAATTAGTTARTTVATTARTTAKTTTGVTSTKLTTTATTTTATAGTSASTTVTTPTTVLVPVKKITGIPTTMKEFETITLNGEIMPKNATKKRIIWSIVSGDMYVSLQGNQLTSVGGVGVPPVIRATIKDGLGQGKDYVEDFTIQMEYN